MRRHSHKRTSFLLPVWGSHLETSDVGRSLDSSNVHGRNVHYSGIVRENGDPRGNDDVGRSSDSSVSDGAGCSNCNVLEKGNGLQNDYGVGCFYQNGRGELLLILVGDSPPAAGRPPFNLEGKWRKIFERNNMESPKKKKKKRKKSRL